jgi:hypothetical protein
MNKFKVDDKVLIKLLGREYIGYVDVVNKITAHGKEFYGYSVEMEHATDSFAEHELLLLTEE